MVKLDLHVHSTYSQDARLRPRDLVEEALRKGLSGVAVTDHGTVKGSLEVRKLSPPGFMVITGVEVETTYGHLLILFLEEEVELGNRDPLAVIDEAKGLGGLVVLPHPFDYARRMPPKVCEELARRVDAVEVFNSRCLSMDSNFKAQRLAEGLSKPVTAGSDAHFAFELGRAWVVAEASDVDGVRDAIIRRRVEVKGRLSPPYVHLMSGLLKKARGIQRALQA
jgi:predicted metal-dependent phosphoesterase TrpH